MSSDQQTPPLENNEEQKSFLYRLQRRYWLMITPLDPDYPGDEELEKQYSFDPRDPLDEAHNC
ncbi:hypothetical protein [Tengunoibacter tsumagoiensis]|uniref:Uncharacterized protein n=1 Tax=Tengunoibacter tsumagoiensis TaxID=2014871 RepID=A0A401ZV65_9CHLR|nr:hypothetical protein [Tengunoibacter tsumagoiensis]GCE10614.1 hypothetical protein KTT_04730 [Tengunoibacter tsumagoiensis]